MSITPATQRPSTIWTRPPPVQIMQGVQPRSYECAGVIDNRIYGGSETKINEMPFTAIIAYFKGKGSSSNQRALTQSVMKQAVDSTDRGFSLFCVLF